MTSTVKPPETNYIIIQRGTNTPVMHWTNEDTPTAFRELLYEASTKIFQSGDLVYLAGDVEFAPDRPWYLPAITLEGIPNTPTYKPPTIKTSCCIDAKNGKKESATPSIVLSHYNVFRKLKLVGNCSIPEEDAAITGHIITGPTFVEFDSCILDAGKNQDWGVYYRWTANNNSNGKVVVKGCEVGFCRFGLALCSSASPSSSLQVSDSYFRGFADGSFTNGATNCHCERSAVCPVLMRSGIAEFNDVTTRVHGPSEMSPTPGYGAERVIGLVTNVFSSKANPLTVIGRDVRCFTDQNNSPYQSDLHLAFNSPIPEINNFERIKFAKGGSSETGDFIITSDF